MAKRTSELKSKREVMRCLKPYVAREIYRQITNPQPAPDNSDLRQMPTELGRRDCPINGVWVRPVFIS